MNFSSQEKFVKTTAFLLSITIAALGAIMVNWLVQCVDEKPPHIKNHKYPESVRYVLPEVSISDSAVSEPFVF